MCFYQHSMDFLIITYYYIIAGIQHNQQICFLNLAVNTNSLFVSRQTKAKPELSQNSFYY
eukprot:UN00947